MLRLQAASAVRGFYREGYKGSLPSRAVFGAALLSLPHLVRAAILSAFVGAPRDVGALGEKAWFEADLVRLKLTKLKSTAHFCVDWTVQQTKPQKDPLSRVGDGCLDCVMTSEWDISLIFLVSGCELPKNIRLFCVR
ncbi:hypothetical protein NDU88_008760 [Pleurodeles waltl]|uniref:Uncharacterized protein n=1 Tax=Pleurodeles waltl TaxID=8319 RepID=A0AAV7RYL0_PLEWA|nr:hypothetical protein NDU88_008760 [Pleurodeles waltl]